MAETESGDGGRVNRSRVVPHRVVNIPHQPRTAQVGHYQLPIEGEVILDSEEARHPQKILQDRSDLTL